MKQGRALSEVLTELQRQNAAKQDFIGPAQAFTLRPDGSTFEIVHTNSGRQEVFGTTDLFHRQIGSTLGIPAKYYDQMRKLKPELLAENVNAWFADREQSYMIRSMVSMLAFWCGNVEEQIDRIFRESGLMREKWDRNTGDSTYGQITIRNAVSSNSTIYTPIRDAAASAED